MKVQKGEIPRCFFANILKKVFKNKFIISLQPNVTAEIMAKTAGYVKGTEGCPVLPSFVTK